MGNPAIFNGRRTKLLTADGILNSNGSINDNNGVKNYIRNGHAEVNTTGWATYADAANPVPVDGTGGSPTLTFTRSTILPLSGQASFLYTSPGNVQGQGASYDFTIDAQDKAKVLTINANYLVSSGTFVAGSSGVTGDVTVWILDVTNNVLIQPSSYTFLSNSTTLSDKFSATFQSASNSVSYRLILHSATASAAFALQFDSIAVSPSSYIYGSPVTDWQSYTPTGSFTTNTTYTGKYRRVGDSIEVQANLVFSGAPNSVSATVNLPAGFSIDTSKIVDTAATVQALGSGSIRDAGVNLYPLTVEYNSTTSVVLAPIRIASAAVSYADLAGSVTQAQPFTIGSGDTINATFSVPILGWSSSVQMSDQTDTRVVAFSGNQGSNIAVSAAADVPFTSSVDTHGGWNGTQYKVIVPGVYQIAVNTAASSNSNLAIYINGASAYTIGGANNTFITGSSGTTDFLKAWDTISVRPNSSVTWYAPSRFSITRISGPAAIAASESVNLIARGTTLSIPNNSYVDITTWPTIETDSHGSFNATTGVYTCNISGVFAVSANIPFQTNVTGYREIRIVQGATVKYISPARIYISGESQTITFVGGDLKCLAGTTIQVQAFQNSGGALPLNTDSSLCIKRVGN